MLVSIDPGTRNLGWAAFVGPDLVACGCSRTKERDVDAQAQDHVRQVRAGCGRIHTVQVVVERMVHHSGRGASVPNDLLDVQYVGAVVAGAIGRYALSYRASDWKGTIPKAVHHPRIRAALTDAEEAIVAAALDSTPKTNHKEILDAIGIGLYHVKRTRKGGARYDV